MASLHPHPNKQHQKSWKIRYALRLEGRSKRRDKYAATESAANRILTRAIALEEAAHRGLATAEEIDLWIRDGFLDRQQADILFSYYATLKEQSEVGNAPTDYEAIYDAYVERSIRRGAGGSTGQTHKSNRSRARKLVDRLAKD